MPQQDAYEGGGWGTHFAGLARQAHESWRAGAGSGAACAGSAEVRARSLAAMAKERSPFWRELLQHVDPFRTDWVHFPITDRANVTARLDETFTDDRLGTSVISRQFRDRAAAPLFGEYAVFYSSGADGRPLYYVYDRPTWVGYGAAMLRALERAGAPADVPLALLGSADSRHTLPRLAPLFRSAQVIGLQDGASAAWRELESMMPQVVIGYSSALAMAARAALAGNLTIKPQYVLAGSDFLSEADRQLIREAWNVDACVYYSITEAGIIASQCINAGFLHINEDQVIVEQLGVDLLVTQLTNRPQPALRYRLAERGRVLAGACPCGSAGARLEIDPGRVRQPLVLDSYTGHPAEVHPIVFRSALDEFATPVTVTWDASEHAILVTGPFQQHDAVKAAVQQALHRAGARATVRTRVSGDEAKASGKEQRNA